MSLLQDRGGGERVCLLLSPWELSIGSWAERPLGLRQPRHKFLAYRDREGRKGGEVRAAEYSALQLGSAAPLCRVTRSSPGSRVRWLGRPWVNQMCNLGQTPSQL